MANEYQGNSIVDYLKSIGKDSSYQARAILASQYGITNYTGSAEQNLQLLNKLKTTTTPTSPIPTSTTPTQQQQDLAKVLAEVQKRQTAGTFTPVVLFADISIPLVVLESRFILKAVPISSPPPN